MRNFIKLVKIFLILITLTSLSFSRDIPKLNGRINDYAHLLTSNDKKELEQYLSGVEQVTSSQIVLLTINSLEGDNLEDFSIRVADKWKIGQKDLDNGAILVIAKKERKIRIEVGYGLEPFLTDAKSSYIIRNIIVPEFKSGNFSDGIKQGLGSIGGIVTKKFDISPAELAKFNKQKKRKRSKSGFPVGTIIFFIIILLGNLGRRRGSGGGFITGMLLGSVLGSSSSSNSDFGSSFGGFSGGGGGFGGGGASGGW